MNNFLGTQLKIYYMMSTFISTTDILRRDTDWIDSFLTGGLSSGTHMIIQNAVSFQLRYSSDPISMSSRLFILKK